MDVLTAMAMHLDSLGLVTFDPTGAGGDTFVDFLPPTPDEAVAITGYGGPESHGRRGWDSPRVQVRVRGGPDPRVSRNRCLDIYDALHGLSNVDWPDGEGGPIRVTNCVSIASSPQALGRDDNNRHSHVLNFQLEVRNPARPAL